LAQSQIVEYFGVDLRTENIRIVLNGKYDHNSIISSFDIKDWGTTSDDLEARLAKKTYLIEHYCFDIRNEIDYYNQTFEEMEEHQRESEKYRRKLYLEELKEERQPRKEKGMSDKEYDKIKKEFRKEQIQKTKSIERMK
jgi:hypothetical protein